MWIIYVWFLWLCNHAITLNWLSIVTELWFIYWISDALAFKWFLPELSAEWLLLCGKTLDGSTSSAGHVMFDANAMFVYSSCRTPVCVLFKATERDWKRERKREKEREKEIERDTERQRETDKDRERKRCRERDREGQRERETERCSCICGSSMFMYCRCRTSVSV